MTVHKKTYANCMLCPHRCGVNRCKGAQGRCRANDRCVINHIQRHMWEEPTLTTNDLGENVGSGTVFFGGCPLDCIYCQNWKISSKCTGKTYSEFEVAEVFLDLQSKNVLNINIVTGTHYTPTIIKAIEIARDSGLDLPIVWNTSGYENTETIHELIPYVDKWLFDFKYYSNVIAENLSKAKNYKEIALNALTKIIDSPYGAENIIVRHLILPGQTADSKLVLKLLFENFGNRITYSIMGQYTPEICNRSLHDSGIAKQLTNFPELERPLTEEEYEEVLDFADFLGIDDYFWQMPGSESDSFIPDFKTF